MLYGPVRHSEYVFSMAVYTGMVYVERMPHSSERVCSSEYSVLWKEGRRVLERPVLGPGIRGGRFPGA